MFRVPRLVRLFLAACAALLGFSRLSQGPSRPSAPISASAVGFQLLGQQKPDAQHSCVRPKMPAWCGPAFAACSSMQQVAVVGNGPLTEEQRAELSSGSYGRVIRFNRLNNMRADEQIDVWVMRNAASAKWHFWGPAQVPRQQAEHLLGSHAEGTSLWFVGLPDFHEDPYYTMQPLWNAFPSLVEKPHALLDYSQVHDDSLPQHPDIKKASTGWIGVVFAHTCSAPFNATLHLFGFNWHQDHILIHDLISGEEALMQQMASSGQIVIHPTAGPGMFTVPAQSLISYNISQFQLLEEVSKPLWIYSTTAELIQQLDFSKQPSGKHVTAQEYQSFHTLNELLKEEVEHFFDKYLLHVQHSGREQVLQGFGWKMLPGVFPTGKPLNMDVSYKPIHVTGENGAVSTHCLLQVIRGQEVHVVRGDTSKAARLYRGKSNSLRTEGVADAQTPVGVMLEILEDILNGQDIDVASVQQLHKLIVTGDFMSLQTKAAERLIAQESGLERDVGQNLMQMLGGQSDVLGKRRRSSAGSVDSDESALSSRLVETVNLEDDAAGDLGEHQLVASPTGMPILEVEEVLRSADGWHFDAFRLAEVTQGRPLSTLTFWLMQQNGVVRDAELDPLRLARFLRRVEEGYNDNPYHNRVHAADVVQSMHMLMTVGGLATLLGTEMVLLAGYMAAACHDFDHPGLNNDFLIRTGNELALLYNDLSPLENHHLATSFKVLQRKDCNFLKRMPKDKQGRLRKMVIEMVLATDMKQHCLILSRFQSKLQIKIHTVNMTAGMPAGTEDPAPVTFDDEGDRMLLLQVALKCADVGHLAAPWAVHNRWVLGLEEEMFRQGDQERALRLPVSPLMDRSKSGITKSQVGFFDLVAQPLFRSCAAVFEGAFPMLRAVEDNLRKWKALEMTKAKT